MTSRQDTDSPGRGLPPVVRLAGILFAGALLALSAALLLDAYRAIPLKHLAARLEAGERFTATPDPARMRLPHLLASGQACDIDAQRALVTVRLGIVDSIIDNTEFIRFQKAMDDARDDLERLLRCHPADGGGWLRLASLDMQRVGPTEETLAALRNSRLLSPADIWNLRGRLPLMLRLSAAGVEEFEDMIEKDLNLLFAQGLGRDIVAVYGATPNIARGRLHTRILNFSFERYANMLHALREAGIAVDPRALPPAHRIPWEQRKQG